MWILTAVLVALGLAALAAGLNDLHRATVIGTDAGSMNMAGALFGIGEMIVGCFLAILARLAQAARHQDEVSRTVGRGRRRPVPHDPLEDEILHERQHAPL